MPDRNRPKGSNASKNERTSAATTTTPWVRSFLKQRPQDMLLPVPKDYIGDNFNLAQLPPIVEHIGFQSLGKDAVPVSEALQQHREAVAAAADSATTDGSSPNINKVTTAALSYPIYRLALRLILREGESDDDDDDTTDEDEFIKEEERIVPTHAIQAAAEALYLLVHARFVISPRGLEAIRHVMTLDRTVFGKCPRPQCRGCGTLPYGYSAHYSSSSIVGRASGNGNDDDNNKSNNNNRCHRYCPSCGEVWISWNSKTDGCAWGPSWCHLFLLALGTQVYSSELEYVASKVGDAASTGATSTTSRTLRTAREHASSSERWSADGAVSASPPPSVFGFRVHPATPFGTPFNEQVRAAGGYHQ